MPSHNKHSLTLSELPRRINAASRSAAANLQWDKPQLSQRLRFVLQLLCESPSHVHIQFADSADMGALNWQFRGKDSPTDVLSFMPHPSSLFIAAEGGAKKKPAKLNLGEIVICADVCAEQCRRHRCTLSAEIERMLVHGLIHLKGFDHERSAASHAVMTALEKSVRRALQQEFGEPDFCHVKTSGTGGRKSGVPR